MGELGRHPPIEVSSAVVDGERVARNWRPTACRAPKGPSLNFFKNFSKFFQQLRLPLNFFKNFF